MNQKPTYEELEQRVRELEKAGWERQREEKVLLDQLVHYKVLIEASLDGIAIIDHNHRVVEANKRFAEMLGYTPEEVLSLHTWDWEAMMTEAAIRSSFADLTKTKTTFETRHRRKDGTIYDAEVTACGAKVGDESMVLTITRDISDRKRAEVSVKESESRYRALFENMSDGVAIYVSVDDGDDFLFVDFNEAAERIENIRKEAVLGRRVTDMFPRVKEFGLLDVFRRVWKTGRPEHHPVSMYKDERIVGLRENFVYKLTSEEIVSIYSDETKRKEAEEALHQERDLLRRVIQTSPAGITIVNHEGKITFANPQAEKVLGLARKDIAQRTYNQPDWHITDYEGNPFPDEKLPFNLVMATGQPVHDVRHAIEWPDRRRVFLSINAAPLFAQAGEVIGMVSTVEDITDRKRAEESLRESEEKLRIRNRIASVFLTKTDEEMYPEILELVLNKLKSRFGVFGYIDEKGSLVCPSMRRDVWDQCQMPDKDIVFPEDNWGDSIWGNGLRAGKSAYANRPFKAPEGHIPIERCLTAPLVFQNRSIGLLTVANKDTDYDESDRESLEAIAEYVAPLLQGVLVKNTIKKALQESEERYRILVEESPLGVSLIGKDGSYRYLNPKFIKIFGYTLEEIPTGKEWFRQAYRDAKYRKEVLATWMDDQKRYCIGESRPRTYQVTCKDGSRKVIHFRPVTMESGDQLVIYEDVTETQRLEERLRRAQKMEALGLLAGGVAHDLNNILSGIVSYPELILMDLPEGSPLRKPMKTIHESGMRAAGVVSDLLTIARGVATGKEALNLNTIISEYVDSVEFHHLENTNTLVHFRSELAPDLLNMRGSPIHLKKTLMNLVTNASEAIEGRGTVTISTFNRYLDEPLKGHDDVRTGEYVALSVSDNGRGISTKDMERIFEPFYTKKVMGRSGTGLGLVVVWNTVQDHNGYVHVETSDKGTVFELYFPVTRKEIAAAKEPVDLKDYMGHGEKILVVDDEESQREIAIGILTKLGYHAKAVSSGEEAIAYVKGNPVDLIVLDMVMPKGMNGRETYEEIITIRPGQKAVISSGYAQTEEVDAAQKLGAGKYLKKPYTLEKIGVAVKEELVK